MNGLYNYGKLSQEVILGLQIDIPRPEHRTIQKHPPAGGNHMNPAEVGGHRGVEYAFRPRPEIARSDEGQQRDKQKQGKYQFFVLEDADRADPGYQAEPRAPALCQHQARRERDRRQGCPRPP